LPVGTSEAGPSGQESSAGVRAPVRLLEAARAGYRAARPAERALLEASTSFAATLATSRTLNYVLERRRAAPRLRGAMRLMAQVPADNSVRVHHFLPGVGIGFACGGVAIARSADGWGHWLSVPFGVGLALTTDELPLLAGRNDAYWGAARFALVQSCLATAVSAGMGGRILIRGRALLAAQAPGGG